MTRPGIGRRAMYDRRMIEVGMKASVDFTADAATTAIALGSGDVPVLGTPKVVALVEEAAVAAIADGLDAGATSVGTALSIDHRAPTAVGSTVRATAVVTSVEGRRVSFAVTVSESDDTVAVGTHTRAVVDRDRFLESVLA